jgi:hypothetical protein
MPPGVAIAEQRAAVSASARRYAWDSSAAGICRTTGAPLAGSACRVGSPGCGREDTGGPSANPGASRARARTRSGGTGWARPADPRRRRCPGWMGTQPAWRELGVAGEHGVAMHPSSRARARAGQSSAGRSRPERMSCCTAWASWRKSGLFSPGSNARVSSTSAPAMPPAAAVSTASGLQYAPDRVAAEGPVSRIRTDQWR